MLMTSRRHRQTIATTAIGLMTFASATGCDAPIGLDTQRGALGSATLVISQIYGGGGNSGAKYKNDFIEIFNRGATAVSVAGWSVQYASATGSSWSVTALSGTIQPGHYYLVEEAAGTGGTTGLPTPDATGTISMSLSSGKVALVRNTTALSCATGCLPNTNVADFVGYGSSADSFEGSGPTATLANTTSALRAGAGCTDTDNNAADFAAATVAPRNSASPSTSAAAPALAARRVRAARRARAASTAAPAARPARAVRRAPAAPAAPSFFRRRPWRRFTSRT